MILAKDLLLLLKEVEKTCIFTQNWLDQLLLVTSYLVTIATDTKCAGGMNEQLLKTSGTDVLSSRKKLRKTLWEGGGEGIHTPLVPKRVNLFKLSHIQFKVNTLAATYLLGFFSPKINSRKSS